MVILALKVEAAVVARSEEPLLRRLFFKIKEI
jgi:hypothetical protein